MDIPSAINYMVIKPQLTKATLGTTICHCQKMLSLVYNFLDYVIIVSNDIQFWVILSTVYNVYMNSCFCKCFCFTVVSKFSIRLEDHQVRTYHDTERQHMHDVLETYRLICERAGVFFFCSPLHVNSCKVIIAFQTLSHYKIIKFHYYWEQW